MQGTWDQWMELSFLGNPVGSWVAAALIAFTTFLVLLLVRRLALRRIARLAGRTRTDIDDFLVETLQRTRRFLLLIPVVYFASISLHLPEKVDDALRSAAVLAVLLQLTLWVLAGINFWVARTRRRRLEVDAASATLIGAIGFIGKVVLWTVLLLLALDNLGVDVTALVAGLGIGGVAVALALQNILGDLLASLSIVLDKPFVIGDTIQVDDFVGTVESIGLKTTHVRSVSGEQLVFSNGDLLRSRIRNHKRMGDRRVVLSFAVEPGTPPAKLERIPGIVREIVESRQPVRFDRAHFARLGDWGPQLEAVWYVLSTDYHVHMDLQQAILLDLLRRLHEEGIEPVFPGRPVPAAPPQGTKPH